MEKGNAFLIKFKNCKFSHEKYSSDGNEIEQGVISNAIQGDNANLNPVDFNFSNSFSKAQDSAHQPYFVSLHVVSLFL